LIAAENQITTIPEGLFKATTLAYLDLSSNEIAQARSTSLILSL